MSALLSAVWRNRWFVLCCVLLAIIFKMQMQRETPGRPGPAARAESLEQAIAAPADVPAPIPSPPVTESPPREFTLLWIEQVDDTREGGVLRLTFDAEVSPSTLSHAIRIHDEKGQGIGHSLLSRGNATEHLLRLNRRRWGSYTVDFNDSMRSASGSRMAAMKPATVRVIPVFSAVGIRAESPTFGAPEIEVSFNLAPDLAGAADALHTIPPVDFSVEAEQHWWGGGGALVLRGDFEPGQSYRVAGGPGLRATQGLDLDKPFELEVTIPQRSPGLLFRDPGFVLSASGSQRIELSCVNVDRVNLVVKQLFSDNLLFYSMRSLGAYNYDWSHNANQQETGLTRTVAETVLGVPSRLNERVEVQIDLRELLAGMTAGVFVIEAAADHAAAKKMVSITDIGLLAETVPEGVLVWANGLRTAAPLEGLEVAVFSRENELLATSATAADGTAFLPVAAGREPFLVMARQEHDVAWLVIHEQGVMTGEFTKGRRYEGPAGAAYVFTDRGVFRPGETVRAETIVRDSHGHAPVPAPIEFSLRGPDGRLIRRKSALLDQTGSAGTSFDLALSSRMGAYQVEVAYPSAREPIGLANLAVESFNPLALEVELLDPPGTWRVGADSFPSVAVAGRYYHGAPAAGRRVLLDLITRPEPPAWSNHSDYVFHNSTEPVPSRIIRLGEQTLDAEGQARFVLPRSIALPASARTHGLWKATLIDVDGRASEATAPVAVDRHDAYVGVRLAASAKAGETARFDLAAITPDGPPPGQPVHVVAELSRIQWSWALRRRDDGQLDYVSDRAFIPVGGQQTIEVGASGTAVEWEIPVAGDYQITIRAPEGARSVLTFFAPDQGASQTSLGSSMENPTVVELEADAESYEPGEIVRIRIRSPFPGQALILWQGRGAPSWSTLALTGTVTEITRTLTEADRPNTYCLVNVIRAASPGDNGPLRALGALPVMVKSPAQQLALTLETPELARPLTAPTLQARLHDHAGEPVAGARVTLWAVDEAICAITRFATPDPLAFFRARRALPVRQHDLYGALLPDIRAIARTSDPGGDEPLAALLNPVQAKRIQPVALWLGTAETDESGSAPFELALPEYAGRLRIMAVAATPTALGNARADLTVRRPVTAQPGLPRFLAPADQCLVPVDVRAHEKVEGPVRVSFTTEGPLGARWFGIDAPDSPQIELHLEDAGANGQPVLFVRADTNETGIARIRLTVGHGSEEYEITQEIGIRPAAPYVNEALFGTLPPGAQVTLEAPADWMPGTTSAELWLAGTPEINLVESLRFLLDYPYGCLEQTASQLSALLHMGDRIREFKLGDPDPLIRGGLANLAAMQRHDGSFSHWQGGDTYLWGSAYALLVMQEARRQGLANLYASNIEAALKFFENRLAQGMSWGQSSAPAVWTPLACEALARAGRIPQSALNALIQRFNTLDDTTKAYTLRALIAAGRRADALRLLQETDFSRPTFGNPAGVAEQSAILPTAIALEAWVQLDPANPRATSLAALLAHSQAQAHWYATIDKASALKALADYYDAVPAPASSTGTIATIGATTIAVTNNGQQVTLPAPPHLLQNTGEGVLHYSALLRGVPQPGHTRRKTASNIRITRTITDADGDTIQHPAPGNPIRVLQGELYHVHIQVDTGGGQRNQLVIQDLLPAGFEVDLAALARMRATERGYNPHRMPLLHFEVRDDRVIIFPDSFRGIRTCTYPVRALNEGFYAYPGVRTEGMYAPNLEAESERGYLDVIPWSSTATAAESPKKTAESVF